MKYAFIDSLRSEYAIVKMCRWLGVSKAGYYKWRCRSLSPRRKLRQRVEGAVVETFERFKHRYGAPRLTVELNELGVACSRNHVAKLLSENNLKARNGKRYKYFPGQQARTHLCDNELKRDFSASKPNEKWVSDITYIKIQKGYVYLAVVMDLFSRKIVGWSLDKSMTNKLVMDAFKMAVSGRKVKPGLLLHSDRGVQYRSCEYHDLLYDHGVKPSMSRKGNCWDNAAMESFFARLKVEHIYYEELNTQADVYSAVFEYIEVFYNRQRRHSANGYCNPVQYEQQQAKLA